MPVGHWRAAARRDRSKRPRALAAADFGAARRGLGSGVSWGRRKSGIAPTGVAPTPPPGTLPFDRPTGGRAVPRAPSQTGGPRWYESWPPFGRRGKRRSGGDRSYVVRRGRLFFALQATLGGRSFVGRLPHTPPGDKSCPPDPLASRAASGVSMPGSWRQRGVGGVGELYFRGAWYRVQGPCTPDVRDLQCSSGVIRSPRKTSQFRFAGSYLRRRTNRARLES